MRSSQEVLVAYMVERMGMSQEAAQGHSLMVSRKLSERNGAWPVISLFLLMLVATAVVGVTFGPLVGLAFFAWFFVTLAGLGLLG